MNWTPKITNEERQMEQRIIQNAKIECLVSIVLFGLLTTLSIGGAIWYSFHPLLNYWGKPMKGDPTMGVLVLTAILMGICTLLSLGNLIRVWKVTSEHKNDG